MKKTEYTPRRANKTRWLQNAPEFILDCFDDPACPIDRYSILFTGSLLGRVGESTKYADTYIMGMGMQGSFELKAHEAASYRFRNAKKRIKWDDIPESFRLRVITWATQD